MTRQGAIIFDLDGTLTRPYLDFDAIRAEMGIAAGPILEAMSAMSDAARRRAEVILHRHESEAAARAELQEGAAEVIHELRERGHPVGVFTRNAQPFVSQVLSAFGIRVDGVRTREDGPIKPSPEPVFSLCREFGADPRSSWVVGDYLFDLRSGRAAGTRTILMIGSLEVPEYAHEADHVIRRLSEVLTILGAA